MFRSITLALLVVVSVPSLASAQAVDDERPPVRPALRIESRFSLRAPEADAPRLGGDRVMNDVAIGFYVGSIGLLSTALISGVASLALGAANFGSDVAATFWTAGYVSNFEPFRDPQATAGTIALTAVGLGVPLLAIGIGLDVASDPHGPSVRAACAPTDGGLSCSAMGTF